MPHKRIEPKLTWKALVKIKWRWRKDDSYLPTHTGAKWFLFGIIPVWRQRSKIK